VVRDPRAYARSYSLPLASQAQILNLSANVSAFVYREEQYNKQEENAVRSFLSPLFGLKYSQSLRWMKPKTGTEVCRNKNKYAVKKELQKTFDLPPNNPSSGIKI